MTKILSQEEFGDIIERIMREEETKARYNGVEFIGLTEEEMASKMCERIGNDWEVK